MYPGCNFGSIADDGLIFETDSPEVLIRFNGQFSQTLTVQSSESKGHRYYLPSDDVEHIAQNATTHGDFSLRKHNAYCVSPGSIHPTTGKQYRVAINVPMVVPAAEEIAFWKSERVEKKNPATVTVDQPIPKGRRNSTITSILGKARQSTGANYDLLIALARQHAVQPCGTIEMNRRTFLELVIGTAACAVAPLRLAEKMCDCGSRLEARINHRCAECATAEEVNYFLFTRGLRPTRPA